jgi:dihydropyrimidinase
VLAVGADADVVIFDPDRGVVLSREVTPHGGIRLHENCDYTPYEGFRLTGWPVLTMSRGEIVARDGEFVGRPGRGRFLRRRAHRM